MTLIIIGNGFFKPNISTLLGNVYNEERYIAKKDEGYNIFYMGINIGAFICNFFGAFMYNILGWEAAFLTAGIGMFIGVIIFWLGTNHFKHADVIKPTQAEDMSLSKISGYILLPAALFGVIGYFLNGVTDKVLNPDGNYLGSDTTDAFILACIPVVIFYARIWFKATNEEKKPIGAMLTIFAVVIAFWAVFKQNGSTLNTWADRYTDREVPTAIAPAFQQLKLVQEIPYIKDSVDVLDNQFRETGKKAIDYPSYFSNMEKDKLPKSGETVYAFNTNLFQSVNPFWVIILTPLVVAFFTFLRYRQKEPSTPTKIFFGLFITALSCLVMVAAVYESGNGAVKASPWWFIASYGVLTIGELCLSPMGLSLVSKLSPPRLTALMMGGWFLATSIGNKLSGVMSSMWDKYDEKANFFWVNFVLLLIASALMLFVLKRLNRIFKEHI
jgi:POT family proton-dependent oligopeptide transporter